MIVKRFERHLGELIDVNPETLSVSKYKGNIQYIDIASVNCGQLDGYTEYDIDVAPSRARRIIKDNDIIYSTVRPNLRAYYYVKNCPDNAICSTGFAVLRAKENVDSRFIYSLVTENSFVNYLSLVAKGSAYPAVDTADFKKAKVTVPDLQTQKRIAEILSAYDDLIENNNRRIALLEKAAQELYKEWFVRFRFPGYENAKFENGLPEGWEYIRFGNAIEIIDGDRGVNYPKQEEFYEDGECLFLNAGNVTKNGFDFSSCAYITKEKDQLLRKGKLQTGDVVLTTRGTVGNVAFLNETMTFSPMRINSGMVILRNLGVVSPEYIYTALRHESLQKAMMMYASGSAQPQLPIKDMWRIKIIKADAKTMDKFTKYVADIYKQVSLMIMKNQAISKQRDLLLPRLMSGKLEV